MDHSTDTPTSGSHPTRAESITLRPGARVVEDSRQSRLVPARVSLAYDWRLLLAIEPLCLLRKHGPVPSHLLIRNLYEGISCLLRKLSRAIRFAPILICSKSHRPLTRTRGVRSANRRCRKLGVGALAKFIPPVPNCGAWVVRVPLRLARALRSIDHPAPRRTARDLLLIHRASTSSFCALSVRIEHTDR
jgi:hypothetical protein